MPEQQYLLLNAGARLQEGDEMFVRRLNAWCPTPLNHMDVPFNDVYRRPIPQHEYRVLTKEDVIQKGDEYYVPDADVWIEVEDHEPNHLGCHYDPGLTDYPYRRKLAAVLTPEEQRKKHEAAESAAFDKAINMVSDIIDKLGFGGGEIVTECRENNYVSPFFRTSDLPMLRHILACVCGLETDHCDYVALSYQAQLQEGDQYFDLGTCAWVEIDITARDEPPLADIRIRRHKSKTLSLNSYPTEENTDG